MSDQLTVGDFSAAYINSDIRFDTPIPGSSEKLIAEQDFVIERSSFTPLAIGTAHPDLSGFYLQKETSLQPTAVANLMRWTRIYAKVPAQHFLPTSVSYNFIGYFGDTENFVSGTPGLGRDPFTSTVSGKIQFDYFLLDGITYTSLFDIPVIEAQKYFAARGTAYDSVANKIVTNIIGYSQSESPAQFVYNLTSRTASEYPTRAAYEAMVAAKTPIVAVPSQHQLWLGYGNIVQRQTIYILPQ